MKNMGEDIYYRCKIVLLGENILLENFSEFRVVGVIGTCDGNIPTYTYDYMLTRPENIKILIVDDNWSFEVLHEFNLLMMKLGLIIGDHYIYHSLLQGKINIFQIYRLFNSSSRELLCLVKKILGIRELVVLHGNCQAHALGNMLSTNKEFQRRYVICEMPQLWGGEENEKELSFMTETGIFSLAGYLFTQEVSSENRFDYIFSTELGKTFP